VNPARRRRWNRPSWPFSRRARAGGLLIGLALLAALGALSWRDSGPPDRPALWRIARGERHGWVFGTIHVVPARANWFSPAIARAVADGDVLILEVTGLAQERRDQAVFKALGQSPGLPPLRARLDPADRPALDDLGPGLTAALDRHEDWAVALMIGAEANRRAGARAERAGEAVLETAFRAAGKRVRGLETIAGQLGRFDALPPALQQALLVQAIRDLPDASEQYGTLYGYWAKGDLAALEHKVLAPLAARPRLKAALIDARNAQWAATIDAQLRRGAAVPFIAVGAGHLVGPDSLLARLAARGWTIERVQ
jgi:uncharacterized protein